MQKPYPHKTVRHVRNSLRPRTIPALLQGMQLSFQHGAARELNAPYLFTFTGAENAEAMVTIRCGSLAVEKGLHDRPTPFAMV